MDAVQGVRSWDRGDPIRERKIINRSAEVGTGFVLFEIEKKSLNDYCIEFEMDQKGRVGQDHGKREHRNHIFSDMLSSPIARKRGINCDY